jgi:hypothetical protein
MTLSELAESMGLTVPQIVARAVKVDPVFLCADPGAVELSDDAESRLRKLLAKSPRRDTGKSGLDQQHHTRKGAPHARKKAGINHKSNRSFAAVAERYGIDEGELRQLALSLGYQAARTGGVLSIAQINQLLRHLNESSPRSFGETGPSTISSALQDAGKLREQQRTRKTRPSPNLRRTRLELLGLQWGLSVATLIDLCNLVRIAIYDPTSPRIDNGDRSKLHAAIEAKAFVIDQWGEQADVRLSKIASKCQVSLAALRETCKRLGIAELKRERICRDDAAYLILEIRMMDPQPPDVGSSEIPESPAGTADDGSRSDSGAELRLDGLELSDQDFSYGDFAGASFRGCDLTRANFTGAILTGVDFSGAILRYAVFEDAVLDEARFDAADVRYARFGEANLSAEQLTSALSDGAADVGGVPK